MPTTQYSFLKHSMDFCIKFVMEKSVGSWFGGEDNMRLKVLNLK